MLNKGKGKAPGSSDVKILEAGASVPFETFDTHLADVKATLVSICSEEGGGREGERDEGTRNVSMCVCV